MNFNFILHFEKSRGMRMSIFVLGLAFVEVCVCWGLFYIAKPQINSYNIFFFYIRDLECNQLMRKKNQDLESLVM